MPSIPRDDIKFTFISRETGTKLCYLRVASRHGAESMPQLLEMLKQIARADVTVEAELETPSRFTPEDAPSTTTALTARDYEMLRDILAQWIEDTEEAEADGADVADALVELNALSDKLGAVS